MEKITLKPNSKELVQKNGEENVHFDVLSYQGTSNQEKLLGSLYVIGQIKYADEDLSYAINLISSLAKREYYSEQSLQGQNAKKGFEHALGKLNEVLDDFFQNKNLKLNIGLVAISGNDIYISRLGKFKVALARDDKYVDVLNNIDLFNKDTEDAKQFSNIISGKLHPKDKIFAYFPTRSVTAREKQLNELFLNESQDSFSQKIAHLAANATNFSCCGVHIEMQEIKEIPVELSSRTKTPILTSKRESMSKELPIINSNNKLGATETAKTKLAIADESEATEKDDSDLETELESKMPELQESPNIIPAEFNITKRSNMLTPLVKHISQLKNLGRLNPRTKSRMFLSVVAIVMLPLIGILVIRSLGPSNEAKNAINKANENFRLAQSQLDQNNIKEARPLLQAALLNAAGPSDKKLETIKNEVNQTLNSINKVSDKQPQLYSDLSLTNPDFKAQLIAASDETVVSTNDAGLLSAINQDGASEMVDSKIPPKLIFNTGTFFSIFNGNDTFGTYDAKSQKSSTYSLKNPASSKDATLYEGNLYILANNTIYKYSDATTGGTKQTLWGSDSASATLISITADGNIYALSSEGKLVKYFKGAKTGDVDLQLIPSTGSRIFTFKDSAFVYLTDKTNGLVYIFDKANGELKTTYDLTSTGTIKDISISPDGSVWALSSDNKVWSIK